MMHRSPTEGLSVVKRITQAMGALAPRPEALPPQGGYAVAVRLATSTFSLNNKRTGGVYEFTPLFGMIP
jgi:hypothetical protein